MSEYTDYQDQLVYVCRKDNVVYCGHRISASSFYYFMLIEKCGWEVIKLSDINWHKDVVFSFILDPWDRHIKGIAADLSMISDEKREQLLNVGDVLFEHLLIFSYHSIPVTTVYGKYANMIHWIPLDLNAVDHNNYPLESANHINLFKKFTEYYNVGVSDQLIEEYNRDSKKLNVQHKNIPESTRRVTEMYNNRLGVGNSALWVSLEPDFQLYHNVIQNTHHWEETWNNITWLNNKD